MVQVTIAETLILALNVLLLDWDQSGTHFQSHAKRSSSHPHGLISFTNMSSSIRVDKVVGIVGSGQEISKAISFTLLTLHQTLFLLCHFEVGVEHTKGCHNKNYEEVHDLEGNVSLSFDLIPLLLCHLLRFEAVGDSVGQKGTASSLLLEILSQGFSAEGRKAIVLNESLFSLSIRLTSDFGNITRFRMS
jgi:hypothetical protein